MSDLTPARSDKFRAYRARKRAAGYREVRRWVWDVNAPAFAEQLAREAEILTGSADQEDAAAFIEAAMTDAMKHDRY